MTASDFKKNTSTYHRGYASAFFYIYRNFVSPALTLAFDIRCRYEESCSRYMQRMIEEQGFFKGIFKGMKRFILCNPLIRENPHG